MGVKKGSKLIETSPIWSIYAYSQEEPTLTRWLEEDNVGGVITVGDNAGGTPSEGVDVAGSSFPSVKNQGLIELVGL